MMSNQKSSLLPRLKSEIDDVTVQPVPVDVHNVNEVRNNLLQFWFIHVSLFRPFDNKI